MWRRTQVIAGRGFKRFFRNYGGMASLEEEIRMIGGRMRIGVVGAGPAGFYTAHSLMKGFEMLQEKFVNDSLTLQVDILERTPVGNGLVRSGVAPDHPEVKHVQNRFQAMLEEFSSPEGSHLKFLGNINIGRDKIHDIQLVNDVISVPVPVLRNCYHGIVFVSW